MLQCEVPHKLKVCICGVFPGGEKKRKEKKILLKPRIHFR